MRRCDGVTRREFLRVGGLSALGLSLPDVLRWQAVASTKARAKHCILIWLDGGPSHLDTFDLKPEAPIEVRGPFKPIATAAPGVRICEHFPRLAGLMNDVCLIRSMTSELGEHNLGSHYLLTGYKPSPVLEYPSYGAVAAHVRPAKGSLPDYIAIPRANTYARAGFLPASCRPFEAGGDPSRPDFRVRDLDLPIGMEAKQIENRKQFLQDFDRLSTQIEQSAVRGMRDAHFEQAFRLVFSASARKAFDLAQEPAKIRERFGHHPLGQSCLLARRLLEAGCPFVTVNDPGWDTHQQITRELKEGFTGGYVGRIPKLDQALSALLGDLKDRELLQNSLVLVMGEFGRTPKLNSVGGRDHWPRVFSLLLAGGGVRGGQVIGASDSRGESPADHPVTPADLAHTIYTLLGINPATELHTGDGRPVRIASGGRVIEECLT